MDPPTSYLQEAADRVEAEARRSSRRADRTQLLDIAEACRALARQLAEPPERPAPQPPAPARRALGA